MVHHFHDGALGRIDLGTDEVTVIEVRGATDGGVLDPSRFAVEHTCKEWPDNREPDGMFIKCIAPRLAPEHVVHSIDPLTVTPSILCPDCGLHGFVTDGVWRAA